jgi:hypothetical protein
LDVSDLDAVTPAFVVRSGLGDCRAGNRNRELRDDV